MTVLIRARLQLWPSLARRVTVIGRIVVSADRIQTRVRELAREIDHAYADSPDLVLVGVLRGAVYFLTDLSRAMRLPHRIDFVEYASYHGTRRGRGELVCPWSSPLMGADVLIVDEVADSGETLAALHRAIEAAAPRSVCSCVLLVKPGVPEQHVPRFQGFRVGPEFLVGYGLDHNQQLRHLPYVAVLEE